MTRAGRGSGPHHTAPCQHPTGSGAPCPNKARAAHPIHGAICLLHAYHAGRNESRERELKIRLTGSEMEALELTASIYACSLSDLGRSLVTGGQSPKLPTSPITGEAIRLLATASSNVNQIAHVLNRTYRQAESSEQVVIEAKRLEGAWLHLLESIREAQRLILRVASGGGDA